MRFISKISLRLRLTILTGILLFVSGVGFMIASTSFAKRIYQDETLSENRFLERGDIEIKISKDEEFANNNAIISLIIFVLGTSASYFIAKKAIQPVTTLSNEIIAIDENSLSSRVKVPKSNDELSKLATSFNKMIDKLDSAFTAQKSFSANAAHELKTPLTAMIASIEVCQIDEYPSIEEYKETLDDVLQNAKRLSFLVNDLLVMMNNSVPRCEKIDAMELFEQIINELQPELKMDVYFENNIRNTTLFGDRFLLHRAFLNILQNAIKYNCPGGRVVICAIEENGMNAISITDNGIGIPENHLNRIFEPFYCVDASRARTLGGSGLGLSIVKSIVEKHGGLVEAHSKPGVSTTFTVRLPK